MKDKIQKTCKLKLLELKDLSDGTGQVAFYFAAWEKDLDGDIILKSAYTKTLADNKNTIYHNRDHEDAVGKPMSFGVDEKGAFCVSQLAVKTIAGNDCYEQYKAGLITGHSQEFITIKEGYDTQQKARIIKEIQLFGVTSVTNIPANLDTPTISVKSFEDIASQMEKINNFLRTANISDGLGKKFIEEYKSLEVILNEKRIEMKTKAMANGGFVHCDNCMKILDAFPDNGKCPECGQFIFKTKQKPKPFIDMDMVNNLDFSYLKV